MRVQRNERKTGNIVLKITYCIHEPWAGQWRLKWRRALRSSPDSWQIKNLNLSKVHSTCHLVLNWHKVSPVPTWHSEPPPSHFPEDKELPLLGLNEKMAFWKRKGIILEKIHRNIFELQVSWKESSSHFKRFHICFNNLSNNFSRYSSQEIKNSS